MLANEAPALGPEVPAPAAFPGAGESLGPRLATGGAGDRTGMDPDHAPHCTKMNRATPTRSTTQKKVLISAGLRRGARAWREANTGAR